MIKVDTVFVNSKYEIRVWKFSIPECVLQFVDIFQAGPIEEVDVLGTMYDYSNHRFYAIYDAGTDYLRYRLRGIDIRYPSLLYDL